MKNPQHHWCVTCDHGADECECSDTRGWRWDNIWHPFMAGWGDATVDYREWRAA